MYFAYPYIVLILSLISSAFHFAFKLDQTTKSLLIGCARDSRSAMILIGHWLLHAFGIIAIAQERDHNLYLPMLGLVPVPGKKISLTLVTELHLEILSSTTYSKQRGR